MADKTWKAVERRVASFFGARRNPLSGSNSGGTHSDSLHEQLFIETKFRVKHSAISLWKKTEDLAYKEGKIPVVALVEKGNRGFWLLLHSADLTAVANQRIVAVKESQ